jgi:N-acetylmuramoyl-L-alanine amidase
MMERLSPNHDARSPGAVIDMLVLHYTGMETGDVALKRLLDPDSGVSAHYFVDEAGAVTRLVPEERRAWHAGVAHWRGAADINARSIGIELVNPGHEFGYRPFTEAQTAAVIDLAGMLVARYAIPARNVVGHSDVAPRRKADPGEFFDWRRLAAAGVGLWPEEADDCQMAPEAIDAMLAHIGYETVDRFQTLKAFQRHFRPERVNGRIDFETARRLAGLVHLCEAGAPAAPPAPPFPNA